MPSSLNTSKQITEDLQTATPAVAASAQANPASTQLPELVKFGRLVIDAVKLIQSANSDEINPGDESQAQVGTKNGEPIFRASKFEVKEIDERWDPKSYEYKTTETHSDTSLTELDAYVFVIRTRTDRKSQKTTTYVDIKSEALRDVLRIVYGAVRVVSLREDKPSIEANFLFNFLPELRQYRSTLDDELDKEKIPHLDLFLQHMQEKYGNLTTHFQSLLNKGEITYDLLWTIFKPNAEIYTTCSGTGVPRCVKCHFGEVRTQSNGSEYFHVQAHYLDYNGDVFGEATVGLAINKFRGAKQINLLPSFPLVYHSKSVKLKSELIERGRSFVSLIGVHHREYEGDAFYVDEEGQIVVEHVRKSRIMVDPARFRQNNPNYLRPSIDKVPDNFDPFEDAETDIETESTLSLEATNVLGRDLQEQELLICNSTVFGFSLKIKKWLQFAVDNVRNIVWNEASFESLALPPKQKRVVQALSEAHLNHKTSTLMTGKGRGLIILLHGPPGVGKTMTAETVSEHLRRPLYVISAGELGTTPANIEDVLADILDLASQWKAILLLDEADIFVEKRSTNDVIRNALVCIFLRMLEYYDGILFLTTNRVQTIDEAMASRIHVPLQYKELDESARKSVWQDQLSKATTKKGKARINTKEMEELVCKKLNGREITNAISAAQAMASHDGAHLSITYLRDALDMNKEFQSDFKGAGYFENQRAYM